MDITHAGPNPADTLLGIDDLQVRYRCGRTTAYDIAGAEGFPNSVSRHLILIPLVALQEWELATAVAGTIAEPRPPTALAPLAPRGASPAFGSTTSTR